LGIEVTQSEEDIVLSKKKKICSWYFRREKVEKL